ncbi:MAG: response regulator transcription factor [Lachnospiraceae bacterium]|nr:response regulator transcription factor [Lachnospiraceae bacterium]MBP3506007.1 response regulator transcription factor [Lachnospiraceae bacterium]
MNILVCDDDREIVEAISIYLEQEGYTVWRAYDGVQALELVNSQDMQLMIIDVMMPNLDGIHAVLELRKKSNIPVIILSAKSEDTDKIMGLTIGADDYVTKPFNPLELVARVKSQLRRYSKLGSMPETRKNVLVNGGLMLEDDKKQVTLDGEPIKLTPTEYKIVRLFMQNPGIVFSSSQIYESIWEGDSYATENIVSVHIRRIREKIEINPKEPKYIKVMWGVGYKMDRLD